MQRVKRRAIWAVCLVTGVGCGTSACGEVAGAARRGDTVLLASGADLLSINPLLTSHPLARQVQRYVLLTTLARYDSALVPQPYLARRWRWSADRTMLMLTLFAGLRWSDGQPTTARDVAWTLEAARDPATGYPRQTDLVAIASVSATDDSTVSVRFRAPQSRFPDVFTDLAILPSHLLDSVPHAGLRRAAWNEHPVGNGPFRFMLHESHRRWVFDRNPDFPIELGGPPRLKRFVIVVVDEPMAKLAALTAGELDFAGINPAHASFVRTKPDLLVRSYPQLFIYGMVLNARRPPFDDLAVRRAVSLAIDRQEIVDGYLFGFGTAAFGPVPPFLSGYQPAPPTPFAPDSARRLLAGRKPRIELLTVGSGEGALEQLLQARLSAVGFEVTIRLLELSAFNDQVFGPRHDFDVAVMGIPGDPFLGYLAPIVTLTGLEAPPDPAIEQHLFADQAPVAWLYFARGLQGMNRRVNGVIMDVRGELVSVAQWWTAP